MCALPSYGNLRTLVGATLVVARSRRCLHVCNGALRPFGKLRTGGLSANGGWPGLGLETGDGVARRMACPSVLQQKHTFSLWGNHEGCPYVSAPGFCTTALRPFGELRTGRLSANGGWAWFGSRLQDAPARLACPSELRDLRERQSKSGLPAWSRKSRHFPGRRPAG